MTAPMGVVRPLWTLPLAGTPCSVCWRPAIRLLVYPTSRAIQHVTGGRCTLPTTPRDTPPARYEYRQDDKTTAARCPDCGRHVDLDRYGRLRTHKPYRRAPRYCDGRGKQPVAHVRYPRGICQGCGQEHSLKNDGTMRDHNQSTGTQCGGVDHPPAEREAA